MTIRTTFLALAWCAWLTAALVSEDAAAQNERAAPGGIGSSDNDTRPYDTRDFRGLWS